MSLVGLLADGIVAVLLVVAVVYCARLEKRLSALRSGQDGLRELVAALDRSTDRAQASLEQLKDQGLDSAGALQAERESAEALLDELKMIVQSADRVADRLVNLREADDAPKARSGSAQVKPLAPASGNIFNALRQAR